MSFKFIILGSGSSMGVPRADGYSGACNLNNKKNHRTRCSALIQLVNENILIHLLYLQLAIDIFLNTNNNH